MSDDATHPSLESARDAAIARLAERSTAGILTLDEYTERAVAVEQAVAAEEIDAVLHSVPENASAAPAARRARWIVAVFGGTEERGRWRLGKRLRIVAVFGGATLDLGAAETEARESVITVVAILGGAEIVAPPGVAIQLSGLSLFGGKVDKRSGGPPLPGSPLIRLRSFALFGGVTVKDRPPQRNLIDAIRERTRKPAATG
jgi:hypothetical protein